MVHSFYAMPPLSPQADDPDAPHLEAFCAGDHTAFDLLARTHRAGLKQLVTRYVRAEADAEDVTQLALVRAFEKRELFRGESKFRTWLYRIAVNVALNHIRKPLHIGDTNVDDIAAFTHSLETSKLVAAEVWGKMAKRIETLPPKQRLVTELRLFHELSFEEVAVIADCTEEAAKMNFHHAVKTLRGVLPPTTEE